MESAKWPNEPVTHGASVSVALAIILGHNFARLAAWATVARDTSDSEGVHQVRVAFRRMRSACTTFRPVVPKRVTQPWSAAMRGLGNRLGPARDLDVLAEEVFAPLAGQLPGAPAFRAALDLAHMQAHGEVRRMLDSRAYRHFVARFPGWCAARGWERADLGRQRRARLALPIETFAAELLQRQSEQVRQRGAAADPADSEALHRLRVECKKLRYLAEFCAALFPGMPSFIAHLKALQDLLGMLHDIAVTPALVAGVLGDAEDPALASCAAALVEERRRELPALHDGFAARWQAWREADAPWRR